MEKNSLINGHSKKILVSVMIIFMTILSINLVLGAEFDNVKGDLIIDETTSKYGSIEIKDWFGLLSLAKLELKKNTDICGVNCNSETEIILYQDAVLIEDVKFIGASVNNPKFYVKNGTRGTGVYEKIYAKKCSDGKILLNETTERDCIIEEKQGNEILENTYEEYKLGTVMKAGTYIIKLEGEKDFYSSTDWIISTQGKEITEWAEWGAGGTITTDGGYKVHTFFTNGTFTPSFAGVVSVLIVAGGGAGSPCGAGGGAGGGGGVIMNYTWNLTDPSYTVVVGKGGEGWRDAENLFYNPRKNGGSNSSFGTLMAMGGGAGVGDNIPGGIGGSGGGGNGGYGTAGGSSSSGQGNNGGAGGGGSNYGGGGGGGHSAVGTAGTSGVGGTGGVGTLYTINGSSVYYGCGGGGGTYGIAADVPGRATCGQGNGTTGGDGNGWDGADYTGAGGGGTGPGAGGGNTTAYSGSGGDGVVIIRYPSNYTPSSAVVTTLNSPIDNYNSSLNLITFNCSAVTTSPFGEVISNISLYLNITGTWQLNETALGSGTTFYKEFVKNIPEGKNWGWTCRAYDNSSASSWATNRTLSVDATAPYFILNNLNNITTLTLPVNATLNVTTYDLLLNKCWYNTSDDATRKIYTCNTPANVSFSTGGSKIVYVYANDTLGNQNYTSYPVSIYDFGVTQKGATAGADGGIYTSNLTIISKSFDIGDADADFWYGTLGNLHYSTKTVLNSSAIFFEKTYSVPNGTGNTTGKNINWYWRYNTTELSIRNTTTQTQTVYSVAIGDCLTSGYARMILNLTLKDEELNTLIDTPATINATIELDLDIISKDNSSMIWSFSKTWINSSNATVCVPDGLLNNSEYVIEFVVGYDATNRVREFYYLENGTLDNTTNFNSYTDNTIDLFDLLTADSTTFLFSYTDANNQEVDDIIVHTFRKYIGDGVFREVERSKQDDNGETHVHLVEEDVIYYFMITQGGTILYTSGTYNAKCLSTPCEILLSASADEIDWNIIENEGNQYTVSSDKSTRLTTISFALNSSRLVNVSLYSLEDGVTATLVNSSSTTGSSGSIILYVPLSYGNTTFFVSIYDSGIFVKSEWVDLTTRGQDYFGTVGALLGGIIVLALLLMAVSEGAGAVVFTILALIVISIMKLVDLGWMALISIICAGGIIIWKLVNRSRRAG